MFSDNQAIERWKELGIAYAEFNFSCGGDSMNDTELEFFTKNGSVSDNDLWDYFDTKVYEKVDFYADSGGHYLGEQGTVTITLEDEGTDEGLIVQVFAYNKTATSEYRETFTVHIEVKLTQEEINFFYEFVESMEGEDNQCVTNFSKDFLLTEERKALLDSIQKKIIDASCEAEFDESDGEQSERFQYSTTGTHRKGLVYVDVSRPFSVFRDSDD